MYVDDEILMKAAELAMKEPELLALMQEWNKEQDWGAKDLLLCKVIRYVKDSENKKDI